jgi:hypothetical protein
MRNTPPFILIVTFLTAIACNADDLVTAPLASPTPTASAVPSGTSTTLPTPTGSPTLPGPIGDHDCGNADTQPIWETYDPDDYPAPPDNYLCFWYCADNSAGLYYPADTMPPHEIIVEFDWDVPYPAYQESPVQYLPCYSAHP